MEDYQKIYVPKLYDLNSDLTVYYLDGDRIAISDDCPQGLATVDIYNSNYVLLNKQIVDTSDLVYSTNCSTAYHQSEFTNSTSAASNFPLFFIFSILILGLIVLLPLNLFRKGYRRV